jgi:hypothetical protein
MEVNDRHVVPTYMLSVLPPNFVRMVVDRPDRTWSFLSQRIQQFMNCINPRSLPSHPPSTNNVVPTVSWSLAATTRNSSASQLPDHLQEFLKNSNNTIMTRLKKTMDTHNHDDDDDYSQEWETLLLFAIFGWEPIITSQSSTAATTASTATGGDGIKRSMAVGCPICFKTTDIELECHVVDVADDRPTKRQKQVPAAQPLQTTWNPYTGHRHYCPFKCGFPMSTADSTNRPIWEVIVKRLQDETNHRRSDQDQSDRTPGLLDSSVDAVRRILRSGIVPTAINLSD